MNKSELITLLSDHITPEQFSLWLDKTMVHLGDDEETWEQSDLTEPFTQLAALVYADAK